jgi:tetratricopeptide (TPR) repeat protein
MAADPVPSQVRRFYALYYLLPLGRAEEAVEECRRALLEDPLDLLGRVRFAQCLQAAGRFDESLSELRRVLELDEKLWFAHFILGLERLRRNEREAATIHATHAAALAPWSPSAKGLSAAVSRLGGDLRRSEEILTTITSGPAYGTPLALATYHMCCSEFDAAADCTERGIAERHPALFFFLRAHARPLLESPRWPALAQQLKLPDPYHNARHDAHRP